MASFSPQQQAFISTLSGATGLHPGVVAAWVAAEEPVGAASGYRGTQDWLNVGITDSGPRGAGNAVWRDPVKAAQATAGWIKGTWSDPGFGRSAAGIRAIAGTAGRDPSQQIAAIQRSGWASSGYPDLPGIFSRYANVNIPPQQSAGSLSSGIPQAPVSAPRTQATTVQQFDQAGFKQAQNRFVLGQFLKQQGASPWGESAASSGLEPLFKLGALPTTAPNQQDFLSAHTVLQKVAGSTPLRTHPQAAQAVSSTRFPAGVGTFGGKPVAKWIVPILAYARAHGWSGAVNSGYRSFAQQKAIYDSGVRPAAVPGTSNHEGDQFPRGAVDVSNAQQLSGILQHSPYASVLVWAGGKDPVHFSHPHNGSY